MKTGYLLPKTLSKDAAQMMSSKGYGFSPGERIDDGQKAWQELRKQIIKDLRKTPPRYVREMPGYQPTGDE